MKKTSFLFNSCIFLINIASLLAQDPLPSWNEGMAKQALIEFVQKTTSINQRDYIPVEERIAAFDQDGTLWTEKPIYTQFAFALSRIKELAPLHPEWKNTPPYQTILDDNLEQMQQFTLEEVEEVIASTHAGITTAEFQEKVSEWLRATKHPRFKRHYTELIYQPMLELIDYLKSHQYKVYIVSGGGQEFIRTYSHQIYGIPTEQVIGSAGKTRYEYHSRNLEKPILVKLPEVLFVDDKSGKPVAIHLFIGKQPVLAVGNSDGDREMLEWSQASNKRNLQLLVHHDDPVREYAYDVNSKIGHFPESLKEQAIKNKWILVSMKNDWKKIFSFN